MPTPNQLAESASSASVGNESEKKIGTPTTDTTLPRVTSLDEVVAEIERVAAEGIATAKTLNFCAKCDSTITADMKGQCFFCLNEARQKVLRVERRRRASGIPGNFVKAYPQSPEDEALLLKRLHGDKRALKAVSDFVADPDGAACTIVGPSGAGKSTLAAFAIGHYVTLTKGDAPAYWADAFEVATARRNSKLGEESEIVERAVEADFLVVDDIGSENKDASEALEYVITRRYASGKKTIYTTWMERDECAARYGVGVARRIFERTTLISLKGGKP